MRNAPDAPSRQPRITYVPALDGMRGISLPGTIYTHFQIFLGYLPTTPWWIRKAGPFTLNIEMFFVLSGALITSLLVSEHRRTGKIALDSFYLRRSRRLGPALIAVVPLLLIAQFALSDALPGVDSTPLGHSPWVTALLVLLFVGNWQLATGGNIGWLGPAWTLGIEEQFYLTWPMALRGVLRRRWERRHLILGFWILIVLCSAVGSVLAHRYGALSAIYMTPTQVPPILLGCALGYALTTNPDGWFVRVLRYRTTALIGLGGMALISALLWSHFTLLMGGGYALYGTAACLLIGHCMALADRPSWVSRALGWKPFVVIGQVSYEAYLVHCIVILAVLRVAPRMPVADMVVLDLALIALISGIFYYFIERPIRRYGWLAAFRPSARPTRSTVRRAPRPARSPIGILAGYASATAVVVVAVFLVSTAGHTPPGPLFSAGAQAPSESVAQAAVPITGTGSPGPGAAHPGAAAPTPTTAAGGSGAEDSGGSPSPTGAEGGQAPVAAAALRPPRITSVLPATGTILGGNTVTIRGRHFTPDAKVFFNSVRVRHVTRLGNRTLRIVVPSAQSVAINAPLSQLHGLRAGVRVVTAGGQSAIGPASLYTYV